MINHQGSAPTGQQAAIDVASFTLHGTPPAGCFSGRSPLFLPKLRAGFQRSAESDAMLIVDAKARFQADTDSNAEKRTTKSDDADLS